MHYFKAIIIKQSGIGPSVEKQGKKNEETNQYKHSHLVYG